MNLFQLGSFDLHSGENSDYKIECDALTNEDWEALAYLIQKRENFRKVVGVPTGGIKLADALSKYVIDDPYLPVLIVDDVLTTGKSMEEHKKKLNESYVLGYVVFARVRCPAWIYSLFQMN